MDSHNLEETIRTFWDYLVSWLSLPQGSARGIGGSEGGFYMKFPNLKACYDYYGFMVASQSNFNQCVGNKDPGSCLLILGRGGYAAAGITEGVRIIEEQ